MGVENNGTLRLLIGEVKVSDEDKNPPQVVDSNYDSISKKLREHIENHENTSTKLWDIARKTKNMPVNDLLFTAAIYWDYRKWSKLQVVCCGVLVRPRNKYDRKDFGLLKRDPTLVSPGKVRFLIVCSNNDLSQFHSDFCRLAKDNEVDHNE